MMTVPIRRPFVGACVAAGFALSPRVITAQEQLVPNRSIAIGPLFERWSFGSGLLQPASNGAGTVELASVSAWSIPVNASIAIGDHSDLDVSAAYANGTVRLRTADGPLGTDRYALSGATDVRARYSVRPFGDAVVLTLGVNLPTGATSLDAEQFAALRVLAAPALGLQSPALGTGFGGTAGVVFARQIGGWAWAAGASYELRRSYSPVSFAAAAAPTLDPGDALHLTLGGDGLVGASGMTIALSADVFADDELQGEATGGAAGAEAPLTTHLGPIFTVDWQLRIATTRFRELTLYAVDRYRTPYERGGQRVNESSGNYLDAGIRSVYPLSPATGVLTSLNLRHQTGLKSDSTLATAATAGAALTLGVVRSFGAGYSLQPFVRGDYATIENVATSVRASGFAVGVSLGRRF